MKQLSLIRGLSAASLVFAFDRIAKAWALALPSGPDGVEFGPFVRIVQVWNPGINFGLLGDAAPWQPWILAGVAVVVAAGLILWTATSVSTWHNLAAGAIAGGALGNAFDRLVFGAVHDYLNVSCCGIQNPYAFNLADTAIVLGVLALVLRR